MTAKEAIEILNWIPTKGDEVGAVDVAIEALSAQTEQDQKFEKLMVRNSNGRPYYSIIYLEFDDNGIGHDFEGYSSYSLDVISDYLKKYFMPSVQSYTESEIQSMQDLEQAQLDKAYELGWKEGREALEKEMWEDGRDRLD